MTTARDAFLLGLCGALAGQQGLVFELLGAAGADKTSPAGVLAAQHMRLLAMRGPETVSHGLETEWIARTGGGAIPTIRPIDTPSWTAWRAEIEGSLAVRLAAHASAHTLGRVLGQAGLALRRTPLWLELVAQGAGPTLDPIGAALTHDLAEAAAALSPALTSAFPLVATQLERLAHGLVHTLPPCTRASAGPDALDAHLRGAERLVAIVHAVELALDALPIREVMRRRAAGTFSAEQQLRAFLDYPAWSVLVRAESVRSGMLVPEAVVDGQGKRCVFLMADDDAATAVARLLGRPIERVTPIPGVDALAAIGDVDVVQLVAGVDGQAFYERSQLPMLHERVATVRLSHAVLRRGRPDTKALAGARFWFLPRVSEAEVVRGARGEPYLPVFTSEAAVDAFFAPRGAAAAIPRSSVVAAPGRALFGSLAQAKQAFVVDPAGPARARWWTAGLASLVASSPA